MRKFCDKIKEYSNILVAPLDNIRKNKTESFVWCSLVLAGSFLGVIFNVIKYWRFDGNAFSVSLIPDSQSGSFYTICIVLIASNISSFFLLLLKGKDYKHHRITVIFLTILIFVLIIVSVFYAFHTTTINGIDLKGYKQIGVKLDVSQFVFFLLTIFIAIYSFGLLFEPENQYHLELTDDYLNGEKNNMAQLAAKSSSDHLTAKTPDGNDLKL